jgi:hypothetical protein
VERLKAMVCVTTEDREGLLLGTSIMAALDVQRAAVQAGGPIPVFLDMLAGCWGCDVPEVHRGINRFLGALPTDLRVPTAMLLEALRNDGTLPREASP